MFEFRMPSLGADMDAGTLVEWLIRPGDEVKRGDIVCEVETQKGIVQVEIWEDGVLEVILVEPGAKVPVGTVLARLQSRGEVPVPAPTSAAAPVTAPTPISPPAPPLAAAPAPPAAPPVAPSIRTPAPIATPPPTFAEAPAPEPAASQEVAAPPPLAGPAPTPPRARPGVAVEGRIRASPAARRLAQALGVDLGGLMGTGPGSAVLVRDVEQAARTREAALKRRQAGLEAQEIAPHMHASPVARRVAQALGIDLGIVQGTARGGVITRMDVERAAALARSGSPSPTPAPAAPLAAAGAPAAPPGVPRAPMPPGAAPLPGSATPETRLAAMRQAIAAAMAKSKREIPHYYLATRIPMAKALAWLEAENRKRPVTERILPAVLLIRAVSLAVHEVPEVNGFWVDGAFQPARAVHPGIAISLRRGGVIAPALHDIDQKRLPQIMTELQDLVQRARSGSLRSSELIDPTLTITQLGDQGVETVFGVIYPPQVALVGFGRILETLCLEDGQVVSRPIITATLSADHRASDGHRGGVFLAAVSRLLQTPEKL